MYIIYGLNEKGPEVRTSWNYVPHVVRIVRTILHTIAGGSS